MLGQPVLEDVVGDPDNQRSAPLGDERRRLEPGVEAMPIHLGFNARQNLVPEVHLPKKNAFGRASPLEAPPLFALLRVNVA